MSSRPVPPNPFREQMWRSDTWFMLPIDLPEYYHQPILSVKSASKYIFSFGEDCAICLENINQIKTSVRLNPCGHFFHSGCFHKYMNNSPTGCPLCRGQFTSFQTASLKTTVQIRYCPFKILKQEAVLRDDDRSVPTVIYSAMENENPEYLFRVEDQPLQNVYFDGIAVFLLSSLWKMCRPHLLDIILLLLIFVLLKYYNK